LKDFQGSGWNVYVTWHSNEQRLLRNVRISDRTEATQDTCDAKETGKIFSLDYSTVGIKINGNGGLHFNANKGAH
jgi:hypothetical protein